jgi:hypothetical protein
MDVQLGRHVAVPAFHRADHLASGYLEGGEQAGGAKPDVIEALPLGHRRRAVQRLDLRLSSTQHRRRSGRIQIQADNVAGPY